MKTILLLLLMQAMTGNRPFTRSVFQGETIILQLTEQQCSGTIAVFSRAYVCRPDNSIVVGVDFLAQPNTYTVTDDDAPIGTLLVMARSYRTRHLSSRACKLSPEKCISLKERRAQERRRILTALASGPVIYTDQFPAGIEFQHPLEPIKLTGLFGDRRFFGKSPSWHRGVDVSAAIGTPIVTASYGAVVLSEEFLLEGATVIIYHGSDISTVYLHLSKSHVQRGQTVNSGDIIGLSGSSGSSGQPHLHFGVYINGAIVDPIAFIEQFNRFLYTEDP
ncbi:MAG: M23 family metallopeptidase [Patescibacteria group bacterium]